MADDHDATMGTDVLVVGQLFVDAVYSGLTSSPPLGEETWHQSFAVAPGGIANHAIALARLGAAVDLRAAIGTGPISELGRSLLREQHISTTGLTEAVDWDLPLTTSLSYDGDRALVTGGRAASVPIARLLESAPRARAAIVHWDGDEAGTAALRSRTDIIIGDIGFDVIERYGITLPALLTGIDVFVPNAHEAMTITATTQPEAALEALAEHVALPIITLGRDGALAFDTRSGERVHRHALAVPVLDTTAAGDAFGAALAIALTTDLPLSTQLDFAILIAGLCVGRNGGVLGAPTTAEVSAWLDHHVQDPAFSRFDACRPALRLI